MLLYTLQNKTFAIITAPQHENAQTQEDNYGFQKFRYSKFIAGRL